MIRARGPLAIVALCGALAACAQSDRLDPLHEGPRLGNGVASRGTADPMETGHRLMAAGEPELALRAFLEAAARAGTTPEILTAIGTANLSLGRLGQAEEALRQATDNAPENVTAWNNLGVVLMETDQYPEAREVFRLAFALDDGHSADIRQNLMRALDLAEESGYPVDNEEETVNLRRQGRGDYVIVPAL